MKLEKISVSKEMKVTFNYNSVGAAASISAFVDETDDVDNVKSELKSTLGRWLNESIREGLSEIGEFVGRGRD